MQGKLTNSLRYLLHAYLFTRCGWIFPLGQNEQFDVIICWNLLLHFSRYFIFWLIGGLIKRITFTPTTPLSSKPYPILPDLISTSPLQDFFCSQLAIFEHLMSDSLVHFNLHHAKQAIVVNYIVGQIVNLAIHSPYSFGINFPRVKSLRSKHEIFIHL